MPLGLHNIHSTAHPRLALRQSRWNAQDLERFWAKVDRRGANDCWLWTASVTGTGSVKHGQFTYYEGRTQRHIKAHRLAWELVHGPIPDGLCICHHCDVARCCNVKHLFLGTQDDNLKDAARKGRLCGSHGPRTKAFTPAERLAIYLIPNHRGLSAELARQYGVSKTAITRIRHGRFVGAPCLEPVPFRQLPIAGEVA